MGIVGHLQELSEKHRQLDLRISEEMSRPGSSDQDIRRLKQQKLKIKEEIDRLKLKPKN
ncbi:MAG: YdcH family protein [Hyphomicrobium sp.]